MLVVLGFVADRDVGAAFRPAPGAGCEQPVVIINRGPTRGDDLATVKIDSGCSETLSEIRETLLD